MNQQKVKKGFKRCSACGKILKTSFKNFYSDSVMKYGFSNNCRECQKSFAANNYSKHADYYKGYINLKNKLDNNKISFGSFAYKVKTLKEVYGISSNSRSVV